MTNIDLADWLNNRAGLSGRKAVTANVIRQWVQWGLLPRARIAGKVSPKSGPDWSRSDAGIRRAIRLAELRRAGVTGEAALVIQAYLKWGYADYDHLRKCLRQEWQKWLRQLVRRQTTFLKDNKYADLSAVKKRAIQSQLGEISPVFSGSYLQQSHEFYAVISEFARFGNNGPDQSKEMIAGAIERLLPGFSVTADDKMISAVAGSFAGLTGDSEEIDNSAVDVIEIASERQFRIARYYTRTVLKEPHKLEIATEIRGIGQSIGLWLEIRKSIYPQISVGPWVIGLFVQMLLMTIRNPDLNCMTAIIADLPMNSGN